MSHEEPSEEQSFADLLNGFSLDSARIRSRDTGPESAPQTVRFDAVPVEPDPLEPFELPHTGETASIVRAYTWTGGRTTSDYHLEIETLVSARPHRGAMRPEHLDVLELCAQPRSVAEIAALRGLPLGVAKVLLGDMASRGLIDVHRTAGGAKPDIDLLERVLSGLRKL